MMDKDAFKEALIRDQSEPKAKSKKEDLNKTLIKELNQMNPSEKWNEEQRYHLNKSEKQGSLKGLFHAYKPILSLNIILLLLMTIPFLTSILLLFVLWIIAGAMPIGGLLLLIASAVKASFPTLITFLGFSIAQLFAAGALLSIGGYGLIRGMFSFTGFYIEKSMKVISNIISRITS